VSVVDASGMPVDCGMAVDAPGASSWQKVAPGTYRLPDLPAGLREFTAYVGGSRFKRTHDPALGDLRIEVPPAGEVDVSVEAAPIDKHTWLHVVLLQEGKEHTITAHLAGTHYRSPPGAVLAGRYTAVLKVRPEGGAERELRRFEIAVLAGQRTTIR
jgi:hypothetical protein